MKKLWDIETIKMFTFLLIIFMTASSVTCQRLYSNQDHVIGIYGNSITINYMYNATGATGNPRILSVVIYYENNPNTFIIKGDDDSFDVESNIPANINGRLNVSIISSNSNQFIQYSMTLNNLTFNDTHEFVAVVVYYVDGDINKPITISSNVTMETRGGPMQCGSKMNSYLNTTENLSNVTVVVTLCGNPRPNITFNIANSNMAVSVNTTDLGFHTYQYTATLPTISRSMCGEELSYIATGHAGNSMRDKSTLQVRFSPPAISITESYYVGNCTTVKWNPVNIGKCTGLNYQIDYVASSVTIRTVNVSMEMSNHTFCVSNTSATNITLVKVRSLYKGQSSPTNSRTPTPLPIVTTPSPTANPVSNDDDDDDDKIYIIIGCCVGGFLLILIILLIICCCIRRRREEKKNATQAHIVKSREDTIIRPQVEAKPDSLPKTSKGIVNEVLVDDTKERPPVDEKLSQVPPIAIQDGDDTDVVYVSQIRYYDPDEFGVDGTAKQIGSNNNTKSYHYDDEEAEIPYESKQISHQNDAYVSDDSETPSKQYPDYNINHSIDDVTEMVPEHV